MARFSGEVGYIVTIETSPGIWENETILKTYRGDFLMQSRSLENAGSINDNVSLNNSISIVADSFATKHINEIRYVVLDGTKWRVSSAEIRRPRIILHIGSIYNE